MKVTVVFAFAFVVLAAGERDWSKIFRKKLKVTGRRIPQKPSTRITHGNEVVPHSIPWQADLTFFGSSHGSHSCGGSLIDEQNVLTTAQCLSGYIDDIVIILGEHNTLDDNENTDVSRLSTDYTIHELWNPDNLSNDIGLIRLPTPVTFNEYIQPISLGNGTCSDDYVGETATASGWGRISNDVDHLTSFVLREVAMPVIGNDECAYYYGEDIIKPTHICTDTSGGKGPCDRDEGGALVLDGEQIGIYSFGAPWGCETNWPAAFTRVCEYREWIEQNKKK